MSVQIFLSGCALFLAVAATAAETASDVKTREIGVPSHRQIVNTPVEVSEPLLHGSSHDAVEETEKQTGFVVRPGMARISSGENVGTNADYDIGSYRIRMFEPFHMDLTEVTWKQWNEIREWALKRPDVGGDERSFFVYEFDGPGAGKADDHPVVSVTWFDCLRWCNARSEKEGLTPCYTVGGEILRRKVDSAPDCNPAASGYRLPTVQEWTYAARGGLVGKRFPWGDTISHDNANYYSAVGMRDAEGHLYDVSKTRGCHPKYAAEPFPYTSPVKSFAPNAYGLYDMVGNVAEWAWASKGSSRVTCGGSWDADARGLRNASTAVHNGPGERDDTIGFRTIRRAGQ